MPESPTAIPPPGPGTLALSHLQVGPWPTSILDLAPVRYTVHGLSRTCKTPQHLVSGASLGVIRLGQTMNSSSNVAFLVRERGRTDVASGSADRTCGNCYRRVRFYVVITVEYNRGRNGFGTKGDN